MRFFWAYFVSRIGLGSHDHHQHSTQHQFKEVGVSKNRGTPKWMVYNGKNPIKMDGLGGTTIFGNPQVNIVKENLFQTSWPFATPTEKAG